MDRMNELKQTFFIEGTELMADMEERLLQLNEGSQDKEQLNAIFRCAHSVKGGAGVCGMNELMQFTHVMEALLDGMREGRLPVIREAIDLLLKSADIVTGMLHMEQKGAPVPPGYGDELKEALLHFTQQHNASASTQDAAGSYLIQFAPHPHFFVGGNDPLLILLGLGRLGELSIATDLSKLPALTEYKPDECYLRWEIIIRGAKKEDILEQFEVVDDLAEIHLTPLAPDQAAAAPMGTLPAPASLTKPAASDEGGVKPLSVPSIRVDLEKVDRLVNMVGELVITEAMLRDQIRHLPPHLLAGLQRGVDELSHHTRELQEAVMAVRMQPVKSIFSRMPRLVRDTAAQLGKDIRLVMSGENTEVDKTVIEQLSDPLTHMIRNSVDHGIEPSDQRAMQNKPAQGTIHLSAYHSSGRIMIEIADDGAGLNREKILGKAKERGLLPADTILTDEETDQLIFVPGFSTAEKVTNVSGRGVGMDVVKRNIESIGGTIRVTNHPGKGSAFTVSLPLTLAILDGMIVRVGGEHYIVPITSIIETLRPQPSSVRHIQGRGDVIDVRGEIVPLLYLHRIFGVEGAEREPSKALIVLVEAGSQKMGIVVDELVGQQQVVIKTLEANADPVKGISGATILGDGQVSLILAIEELCQLGHMHSLDMSNRLEPSSQAA